jgi:hypothetical protein
VATITRNSHGTASANQIDERFEGTHSIVSKVDKQKQASIGKSALGTNNTCPLDETPDEIDSGYSGSAHKYKTQEESQLAKIFMQKRQSLARRLVDCLDRLRSTSQKSKRLVESAVIKRILALCHTELRESPSEVDFLSFVTLFESAIEETTWIKLESYQLREIHKLLIQAANENRLDYNYYTTAIRVFRGNLIKSLPSFEIDFDEDEDGEEEKKA